ncbi:MAG: hypothetical protein TR69_WS6001000234 [candidate division WS6 bacterium OLB20]|uniref:Uncharacterized protein n=1 Tax=candidate division WS6 bacterium OLB20 TaxID=1617426 RepID=A0A136M0C7_9BACT|nr:MAG: hypothetical protein TR69_WS6001000234 [candidate division WS6 bacterium OLB20]
MLTKERQNIISLFTLLLVSVPYLFYILGRYQTQLPSGQDELHFWAAAILLMIPLRIVAEIIMYILAAIAAAIVTQREDVDAVVDERDRIIELKGTRNSYFLFAAGFAAALLAVVAGGGITTLFLVLLVTGMASELFGIFSQMFFYRRGY